jgi:serine/threonine-protein kinase
VDTDHNLLFGVLALQADLLTPAQFAEACSAWAGRKSASLADLLVERGWLTPTDRTDVEKLLQRKLAKHGGDSRASLAEVTTDEVRLSLAGVPDEDLRGSLTPLPAGDVLLHTTDYVPEARERYTLSRLHATGGIGRVWLARDASLGRDVALKELRPERVGQPVVWGRFLREAQVTGQLEHPGIVPVYDLGRRPDDNAPFYTMRFVRGRTLAEAAQAYHKRRQRGTAEPLELRELLTALIGVCHAVAYAHSRGVLHRDLKPQNVVLGDYGEVMVLDWGLAKVAGEGEGETVPVAIEADGVAAGEQTLAGQVLGTPAYMSPEQAEGRLDLLDARTDVYGLGAVLYEVLTGQVPFAGADTTAVLQRVLHEPPAPPRSIVPGVPRALEAVCLKALAKRPAERFATVRELGSELQHWLADEPVSAYRDPWTTRLTRWGRRHRTLAAVLAVAVLAVLGGLGAVLAVQHKANLVLEGKNLALAERQAEVEARFEQAQKAIATFHTVVSEDAVMKNPDLTVLRTKLLREAARFYRELGNLLVGKTDAKSRRLLAEGQFQLGELTEKIGDVKEALAVYRQALAVRQELAAAPGANTDARLAVSVTLRGVGRTLYNMGDAAGALQAYGEARDLAERLAAEDSADAIRADLARLYLNIGIVLSRTGRPAEALTAFEKARDIDQKLADAGPADTEFQTVLANIHNSIAMILAGRGLSVDALAAHEKALAIRQKLADANPAVIQLQHNVADSHFNIGLLRQNTGRPAEALAAFETAQLIRQKLADANPAVTSLKSSLAVNYRSIGGLLSQTGRPTEAQAALEKAQHIYQKLADVNPAIIEFQLQLAAIHTQIAGLLWGAKPAEALAAEEKARAIFQKLADASPNETEIQWNLAISQSNIGEFYARHKRFTEAFGPLGQSIAIMQRLTDKSPDSTTFKTFLGCFQAVRGLARAGAGQPTEAAADLRRAVEILSNDIPLQIDQRIYRSWALALLAGLGADAKSGVTAAEAARFADQSVAALRDAVQAGWARPDELKEPEFDPIRKRDDFQKLVKELEAKAAANRAGPDKQPQPNKK